MVKFIVGEKGTGKTKMMISMANEASKASKGHVVYIDRDKNHMYDLDRSLRFINAGDFQIENLKAFYGFLCGVISQNFDIETIFIDGIKVISDAEEECLKQFVENLENLNKKFEVDFIVSMSRNPNNVPEFLKSYF
ncbi:ATP-binding protein [Lutispora thermophila]|uniref:Twitching motility protein PilT n=1 Tax=Lutispora thermophila DSM 19022 TaxID=1122184 RepID=A0A1M6FTR0_9FIRM|nr:ATP-binding protein [Lutispora thermophila]SHJ01104.1 hypothetical protein SAMN02745176_02091 [Lutispora thermophila DSM 19022]